MSAWLRAGVAMAALVLGSGCWQGESEQLGFAEDFRVRDAQFVRGSLPGEPPADATLAGAAQPPSVTALETLNSVVAQGQAGKPVSGRVSPDAVAIALALEGIGDGHWVLPVVDPDPVTGELTWRAIAEFGARIPAGRRQLRAVAIDASGHAGRQLELGLCVGSRVPDNLNACDPKLAPPAAVITLHWDADADVDLQVLTPDGRLVEPKQPTTEEPSAAGEIAPEAGVIDRDSIAACVADGARSESLVWNAAAPSGRFRIYASLFDACRQAAVRFTLEVYTAQPRPDDEANLQLVRQYVRGGELLEPSASAGRGRGLFITEYEF